MIRRAIVVAAIVLATTVQATGQDAKFLRVYFVGNSVTDTINYGALAELAKSRGYQQVWGRHMIPGAPLQWIWQHPKDGFQEQPFGHYPNALAKHQWDVLSLQPFDRHLEGNDGDLTMAKNFIDLALPKSPDFRSTSTPLAKAGEGRLRHGMAEEVHGRMGRHERNQGLL